MLTLDVEEHILHDIENNTGISSRQVAHQPITSNVCRDYHWQIFLHRKDSVAGLCNRPSPLWDF